MRTVRTVVATVAVLAALVAVLVLTRGGAPAAETRGCGIAPVLLAGRTVDPQALPEPPAPSPDALSVRGTCAYVVQCAKPVSGTLRIRVAALGARVISFIPENALLVEASPAAVRRILRDADFTAAFALCPSDKMQPGLTGGLVTVAPLAEEDQENLIAFVSGCGGTVRLAGPSRRGSFHAEVSEGLLQKLAGRGDVRWIERYAPPVLLNDCATVDTGVRTVRNSHGLTGRGQVIASADSGLDTGVIETLHPDFTNRVMAIVNFGGVTTGDICGHGTHTAGTLAGDGRCSDGQYAGVAPEARLYIQACGTDDGSESVIFKWGTTYEKIFAGGWPSGACIHSDSWGSDTAGAYDEFCEGLDEVVWHHPELLVVVACGNAGPGSGTVGSPASAKNALAVGNVNSSRNAASGQIYSSSSRGPCADGRIKPELTAPGRRIVSARSSLSSCSAWEGNDRYTVMTGTSMATPHVAGCAALVRQWLVERRGYTNAAPTAALVKAVLTGGADGLVPDNAFGWGRIALDETLYPSNRAVRLIDRLPVVAGCDLAYDVSLTNEAPFDVQLTWIDPPGEPAAARTLVNDLDLVVSNRETGAVWCGNAVTAGDRTNNVESVRLPSAPAGEYVVFVRSVRVPYAADEGGVAALYLRGAFDESDETEMVTLRVSADFDAGYPPLVDPAAGEWNYPKGSIVALSVRNGAGGTNAFGSSVAVFPCCGYVGTGSVPASGTETNLSVALNEDSTISWQVASTPSHYLLTFCTMNPDASRNPFWSDWDQACVNYEYTECWWIETNADVVVSIPADLPYGDGYLAYGYSYNRWRGAWQPSSGPHEMKLGAVGMGVTDELDEIQYDAKCRMARKLDFRMDGPKDIWAYYYDRTATVDGTLPVWWYARYLYGSVDHGVIDEATSLSVGDPDGDGFSNAAEYADETDPVDDASFRLKIDAFSPTNMAFTGSVKGKLIVERSDRLDGGWKGVLTNSPPRTSVENKVTLVPQSGATNEFYRVIYRGE